MEGVQHNSYLKRHIDKGKTLMYFMDSNGREEAQTNKENNDKNNISNLKVSNNCKTNANIRIRTYQMFVDKNLETRVEKHHDNDSEGQQIKVIVSSLMTNTKHHNQEWIYYNTDVSLAIDGYWGLSVVFWNQ